MINNSNVSRIKRSQKEATLMREISKMVHQISLDDPEISGLFINRVELSKNKGVCIIFFYDPDGIEKFNEKKKKLMLYKPSIRKGIAATLDARYTPELKFTFDTQFEKQQRIENILMQVKKDIDKHS